MALTDDDITATNSLTVTNKLTVREGNPVNPGDFVSTFAEFLVNGALSKAYVQGKFGLGTVNPTNLLDVAGGAAVGANYRLTAPPNGLIVEGDVGIGTSAPRSKLEVDGDLRVSGNLGINTAPAHRLHIVAGDESDNQTFGAVVSVATGAGAAATTAYSADAVSAGAAHVYGVRAQASGSGTGTKVAVRGVAFGEGSKQAGWFEAITSSTNGGSETVGVRTVSSSQGFGLTTGLDTLATGPNGSYFGVRAIGRASGSGSGTGGSFHAEQTSATNANTIMGLQATARHAGSGDVYGISIDLPNSGASGFRAGLDCNVQGSGEKFKYGIKSQLTSTNTGIYAGIGVNSVVLSTNGAAHGVLTSVTNNEGSGVSYGVRAVVSGTSTGGKYAVYGSASGGGELYAGYFLGNVFVGGTLSKTAGTFLIDHPLDPYNRLLRHNFVESPEELCLYRGTVHLDSRGTATVKMPSYFVALTKEDDASIVLTAVGKQRFQTSYEWSPQFDAFTVFGNPDARVSYLVMATRDDPAAHKLRRPVEEDKAGEQKGKLLFPQAYGDTSEAALGMHAEVSNAVQAEEKRHARALEQRRGQWQADLRRRDSHHEEQSIADQAAEAARLDKEARSRNKGLPS